MTRYALAVLLVLSSLSAGATRWSFEADLSGGAEFPPVASPGTGFASVLIDDVAHTMLVEADFSTLLGTTAAAHIHCCVAPDAPVPNAGVATQTPSFAGFPAGVTAGSYSHLFDLADAGSFNAPFVTNNGGTPTGAELALLAGLIAGEAYFNIHTTAFPSGEIRGFLARVAVPAPATALLVALGLGPLAVSSRRRTMRGRRALADDYYRTRP